MAEGIKKGVVQCRNIPPWNSLCCDGVFAAEPRTLRPRTAKADPGRQAANGVRGEREREGGGWERGRYMRVEPLVLNFKLYMTLTPFFILLVSLYLFPLFLLHNGKIIVLGIEIQYDQNTKRRECWKVTKKKMDAIYFSRFLSLIFSSTYLCSGSKHSSFIKSRPFIIKYSLPSPLKPLANKMQIFLPLPRPEMNEGLIEPLLKTSRPCFCPLPSWQRAESVRVASAQVATASHRRVINKSILVHRT